MAQEKYLGENGLKRLVGLVKEDLGTKANIDGSYDGLQAGSAKQIVSPTGITDTTPYVFRTTCGETSISGGDEQLASLKAVRGNTIAWNQKLHNEVTPSNAEGHEYDNNSTLSITNGKMRITSSGAVQPYYGVGFVNLSSLQNHKVLCTAYVSAISLANAFSDISFNWGLLNITDVKNATSPNSLVYAIGTWGSAQNSTYLNIVSQGTPVQGDYFIIENYMIFDLTQMFGPGNEPTSVLEFTRLFPKTYYPFNPGEIRNVKTKGLKTIGYNAFDGILEQGGLGNGQPFDSTANVRSKNFIKVVGGQTYTLEESATSNKWKNRYVAQYDAEKNHIRDIGFGNSVGGFGKAYSATLDDNCCYVKIKYFAEQAITPSDFHDVAFHVKWSGSRTGYVPHEEHILHIDTSRYFPDGMNGVGTAYDELTPKVAIKRFAKVDLGTLNWNSVSSNVNYRYYAKINDIINIQSYKQIANIRCSKLSPITFNDSTSKEGITTFDQYIYINSTISNLTDFRTAMSGVYLIYELATPEITEIPQVRDNHWEIKVDDYGTEGWLFAEGDEIPVPVGHETLYMDNLVDKLRNLPDPSDYEALESEVQTWVKLPPLPTDTTKVYVPKFVNGTIKWVEE